MSFLLNPTFEGISTIVFFLLCIIWQRETLLNLLLKVIFGLLAVWGYHTVWGS